MQNNTIFEVDKIITADEIKSGHARFRKTLLSLAEGKVLETGVGTSNNLRFYPKNKGIEITAIDYSPNAIELALERESSLPLKYELQDIEELSYVDNTFDCIVDTFGFEFYQKPEIAFNEIRRVCKPNGLILLLEYGKPNHWLFNKLAEWNEPVQLGQYGRFTMREWDKLFEGCGAVVIQAKRFRFGGLYYYVLKNTKPDKIN